MKVYIFADQEGVAGVFSRREHYLFAQEYATIELAAICEALLGKGVDEIVLNTIHVVDYEKLPAKVRIIHGLPARDFISRGLDSSFDASFIVGMHEMAGSKEKGCWRHTILPHPITFAYSSVEAAWLNNQPIGELGLFAVFAGIHDVPVTLVTGDHWACVEGEELIPGVETVAVKKGMSYFSAISMTPQAAAEASAAAALRSLGKIGEIKPVKMEGPATLKVRYQFAQRATDATATVKNTIRIDERTVAVTYPTIEELHANFGTMRAPEHRLYRQDIGLEQTTGLFTRYGPEPYEHTMTVPKNE